MKKFLNFFSVATWMAEDCPFPSTIVALFRGKLYIDFTLLLFPYLHFSFTTKKKRKLEW